MAHPITTMVTHEKVLPLQELLTNKFLGAGLNIHFEDGKVYITSSCWAFLQLAKALQSKELIERLGVRMPMVVDAFLKYHKPTLYTSGESMWSVAPTPEQHRWASFKVTVPVPIRTQMFKHKIGFVENEVSRRYVKSEPVFTKGDTWREKPANAKQGSGGAMYISLATRNAVERASARSLVAYKALIDEGVCAEQARFYLLQAMETSFIWTGYRYAFENFFSLRCKKDAQLEVQEIAQQIQSTIQYQGA